MEINPQFQTMGQLLTGRLFRIPEYQRAYSWERRQREDLFKRGMQIIYGGTGTKETAGAGH